MSPDGVESGRCRFLVCSLSEGSNTDFTGESSPTSNSSWCRCFICPFAHTEQRRTCTCVDFCDLCTTGRLWQEGEACWRNLTCSKRPSLMSGVQRHHTLILCEVKISCKKKKVVTSSVQLSFSLQWARAQNCSWTRSLPLTVVSDSQRIHITEDLDSSHTAADACRRRNTVRKKKTLMILTLSSMNTRLLSPLHIPLREQDAKYVKTTALM